MLKKVHFGAAFNLSGLTKGDFNSVRGDRLEMNIGQAIIGSDFKNGFDRSYIRQRPEFKAAQHEFEAMPWRNRAGMLHKAGEFIIFSFQSLQQLKNLGCPTPTVQFALDCIISGDDYRAAAQPDISDIFQHNFAGRKTGIDNDPVGFKSEGGSPKQAAHRPGHKTYRNQTEAIIGIIVHPVTHADTLTSVSSFLNLKIS